MPSRKLPADQPDADDGGVKDCFVPASTSVTDVDELARAEARAEAARARALRLRHLADASSDGQGSLADGETTDGNAVSADAGAPPAARRRRLRRPGRKALAVLAAFGSICVSLAGSGYLLWHHHEAVQKRQRTAEFATAARNSIQTMLTINSGTARADVQRFVDETTGQFKAGILLSAEEFVKAVEQSNGSSKGTVQAVAVQSMTDNSAIVLVAAKSELGKPGGAKPESRAIRIVVDLLRDGGQLKMSRVEFVP